MSTEFNLTLHPGYIHVELAPGYEFSPEGTTQLTLALSDVVARQNQRRVLIEGTVAQRQMGTMDSFGFGSLLGTLLPGVSLACCLYGFTHDDQTQFFKDVTQNRGVRIEFFANRDAALRWLGVGGSTGV
jgi:hypothetical protein